jgi:hypothetical protein
MPAPKNPELTAVQQIVSALQPLDPQAQDRVLSSVLALLGRSIPAAPAGQGGGGARDHRDRQERHETNPPPRPKGLTELVAEKRPGTNAQRIALFAYYRDKYEDNPRFGRADLEGYFGRARVEPPGNYDRDFNAAVDKGWIHENGDQSYVTTSGIEVVEQGFEGKRSSPTVSSARKKTGGGRKSGRKRAGGRKRAKAGAGRG